MKINLCKKDMICKQGEKGIKFNMMNEENFINEVWNKYEKYNSSKINDKFYKKNLFKSADYTRCMHAFLSIILIFACMFSITYASNKVYESIVQNSSQKNTAGEVNYDEMYGDLVLKDGRFYKKVYSYDEYLSMKERFGDIAQMTEEDFDEYFVLVIVLEKYEEAGTYISDIGTDNKNLYIELKKYSDDKEYDINNNVLSTKISKEQDRENVEIELVYEDDIKPRSDEFINLEDVPADYTVEQAISDGCFVIQNQEILSPNKNMFDEFIEKTQNGEESFIRVIMTIDDGILIKDIQYKNGKYLMCTDSTREEYYGDSIFDTEEFQIHYFEGTEVKSTYFKDEPDGEIYAKGYKILINDELYTTLSDGWLIICSFLLD